VLDAELITHNIYTHGYHLMDDFLDATIYQELCNQAHDLYLQGVFKSAKIGQKIQAQRDEQIRGDTIYWIDDEESTSTSLQAYLSKTQQVAQVLNHSLFLGLFEFETHFAIYQPGTYYKKHIDQFATTKDRKISFVYYLNPNWRDEMGGQLNLYTKQDELIRAISPEGNRFICFNSELPHEVALTHQTRYSITGWMKTRALSTNTTHY
jgi:SM-20-related protein